MVDDGSLVPHRLAYYAGWVRVSTDTACVTVGPHTELKALIFGDPTLGPTTVEITLPT